MLNQSQTSRKFLFSKHRSISLFLSIAFVSATIAQGSEKAELLIVHQKAQLVTESQDSSAFAGPFLRSGTTVLGIRKGEAGDAAIDRWFVRTTDANPQQGWVSASEVTPFGIYVKELKARAIVLRRNGNSSFSSLPELIALQENPAIRKAWGRVETVFSENENLPENERLPEPYFARAEIWSSVKNYFAALQDYLVGIKYARSMGRDVGSYSAYFDKLAAVANNLESNPVAATGAAENKDLAKMHYSLGLSDYFVGSYSDALSHFNNAVALAPVEAHYWYFRSLSNFAMGDTSRASHDALLGAHFEKASYGDHKTMNSRLGRVQGNARTWLERYRTGLATFHIMGAANDIFP